MATLKISNRAARSRIANQNGTATPAGPTDLRSWDKAETVALAGTAEARELSGVDGNIAYAKGTTPPWHGFGNAVDGQDPRSWLKASGTDFTVSLKPMQVVGGKVIPGRFAIVRDDTGDPLSTCGKGWNPFQNEQVAEFFQKYCEAGQFTMETFGSLHGGRYIWGLARVGDEFRVGREDVVKGYVLLMNPHEAGKAAKAKHVALRTECQNSLARGLGEDGLEISIPHNLKFDDAMKRKAERALKLSQESLKSFAEAAARLSEVKVDDAQADDYFKRVFKLGEYKTLVDAAIANTKPEALQPQVTLDDVLNNMSTPEEVQKRTSPVLVKLRESWASAPGADMDGAKGTLWGALNAVTYDVDHKLGGDADLRLRNAWFGYRADDKQRALDIALQVAGGEVKLSA